MAPQINCSLCIGIIIVGFCCGLQSETDCSKTQVYDPLYKICRDCDPCPGEGEMMEACTVSHRMCCFVDWKNNGNRQCSKVLGWLNEHSGDDSKEDKGHGDKHSRNDDNGEDNQENNRDDNQQDNGQDNQEYNGEDNRQDNQVDNRNVKGEENGDGYKLSPKKPGSSDYSLQPPMITIIAICVLGIIIVIYRLVTEQPWNRRWFLALKRYFE